MNIIEYKERCENKSDTSVVPVIKKKKVPGEQKKSLIPLLGKRILVFAYFTRFGQIGRTIEGDNGITLLVKNPYTFVDGQFVPLASHAWIRCTDFKNLPLAHGDKVSFYATVVKYTKLDGIDYGFQEVNDLKIRYKNNSVYKLGIFNLNINVPAYDCIFVSSKGGKLPIVQAPIKLGNGILIRAPFSIKLRLKDISGPSNPDCNSTIIYRFLFKFDGDTKWRRYGYYLSNRGQRIYLTINNRIQSIIIDEKTFFHLKDATSLIKYGNLVHLPAKNNQIKKLARQDKNKVDSDSTLPVPSSSRCATCVS